MCLWWWPVLAAHMTVQSAAARCPVTRSPHTSPHRPRPPRTRPPPPAAARCPAPPRPGVVTWPGRPQRRGRGGGPGARRPAPAPTAARAGLWWSGRGASPVLRDRRTLGRAARAGAELRRYYYATEATTATASSLPRPPQPPSCWRRKRSGWPPLPGGPGPGTGHGTTEHWTLASQRDQLQLQLQPPLILD